MGDLNVHTNADLDHNPFGEYDREIENVPPSFAGYTSRKNESRYKEIG